jgi:predicted DCC family thiol-disulfide oxidoreductase YuxK
VYVDIERKYTRMVTAIYDGKCVICNQSRRMYTALDWFKRIEFLDLHRWDEVMRRYPTLDYNVAMGQMHLATQDGTLVGGFPAVRRMLKEIPVGYPFWLLMHIPGVDWLGDRFYRFIARNRYRINKLVGAEVCEDGTCKIHT